ncbi:MAG: hypothetical protein M1838_002847 [Thelocarpon superellum]|nr:MAG: hypothetical protein M1838_002847 [Thelocarpon superellum]
MPDTLVSHGRGGAGNLSEDTASYTDGEIRGGQGNIAAPGVKPAEPSPTEDVAPEEVLRPSSELENYHFGLGGEGNIHQAEDPYRNQNPLSHDTNTEKRPLKSPSPNQATNQPPNGHVNQQPNINPTANGGANLRHEGLADKLKYKLLAGLRSRT